MAKSNQNRKYMHILRNANKRIAFITHGDQFLPELTAYSDFFHSLGWIAEIFRKTPTRAELEKYNVEWHFMGLDKIPKVSGRIKIHEYCSVSTPPMAKFKNRIKKCITVNPDYRIFQSMWVANEMKMYNKPYILRDMGIRESFFVSNDNNNQQRRSMILFIQEVLVKKEILKTSSIFF
jgi:hypothetical protein